jgi:predicted nucleic acid-binding protein
MPAVLVDTDVLVYFFDNSTLKKQERAELVLNRLREAGLGRLNTQNLAEFINAAMRKLDPPMTAAQAFDQAALFAATWPIFNLTPQIVLEAARGVRDHRLAYYDSQMWASARLNQIPVIFSEAFQDGQILEGVLFANPFTATFDLETWL